MIFSKNIPFIQSKYTAPNGTIINVDFSVAESDPPQYTYYISINGGENKIVEWSEIYHIMHNQYGIPDKDIPNKYKPNHLKNFDAPAPPPSSPLNCNKLKFYDTTYTSKDGNSIEVTSMCAESDPPQYTFYYTVDGKSNNSMGVDGYELFKILTETYGISQSDVDHYKGPY